MLSALYNTQGLIRPVLIQTAACIGLTFLKKSIQGSFDCDSTVSFLVQVVNNYKKMDLLAQARFSAYEIDLNDKNKQITNLTSQINIKDGIIAVKDSIIGDDKKI